MNQRTKPGRRGGTHIRLLLDHKDDVGYWFADIIPCHRFERVSDSNPRINFVLLRCHYFSIRISSILFLRFVLMLISTGANLIIS